MTSEVPLNVSPALKFSRWALLSAGVFYGMKRHATLSAVEKERREKREAMLKKQEPILRREKERRAEEEFRYLQRTFLPEDFPPGQVGKQNSKCKN